MQKEIQKKSLDRFFRNEYQKLVNFIRKNLDDRYYEASPEDIIQDVALGLIDKLDLDAQIGNLTGYIYRSVKNRIIDYQKKKQRNVSIETFADRQNGNYLLNTLTDETLTEEGFCILDTQFKKSEQKFNHIINKYTKLDPTLPRINNVRCPNASCQTNAIGETKPAEIIYIRYDDANLKYIYICSTCDTTWKTDDSK